MTNNNQHDSESQRIGLAMRAARQRARAHLRFAELVRIARDTGIADLDTLETLLGADNLRTLIDAGATANDVRVVREWAQSVGGRLEGIDRDKLGIALRDVREPLFAETQARIRRLRRVAQIRRPGR